MNQRERLIETLNFEKVDRLPIMDFGYWEQTIENWQKEGLPPQVKNQRDVENYLSLDRCCFDTHLEVPQVNYKGVFFPPFEKKIIDEDEETITKTDSYGVTLRENKRKGSCCRKRGN